MGDQGPCGPCSEIHIDLRTNEERAAVSGRSLVNADHPQVVEIWNNVFMEFLSKDGKVVSKLEKRNVDTGAGFERMVAVIQGKSNVFETDIFSKFIIPSLTSISVAPGRSFISCGVSSISTISFESAKLS